MNKLRNLDTTELLILVGILGILIFGGFHFYLRGEVERARDDYSYAKREIPRVFSELVQLPELYQARRELQASSEDVAPAPYFNRQFTARAKIPLNSYIVGSPRESEPSVETINPSTGRPERKKVAESVLRITFKSEGGKKTYLPRSNIFRAIYNAEAQSKRWKLRSLELRAKEADIRGARDNAPPEELSDEWSIGRLEFVSRKSLGKGRR